MRDFAAMSSPPATPSAERQTLEREGWLFVPRLIDDVTLRALLRATETLERGARDFQTDTTVLGVGYEVQSKSGRKGEPAVFPGALRKITFPSKSQGAFSALRRDARVLELVQRCGLEDPRCHVDQVNFKLPRVGTGFPFHQDAAFVVGKTRGRIERHGGVNLVIALDRADAENGGFQVLGRTHRQGLLDVPYDASTMNEGVFDESHRALVALDPGDAVLFHPHLAHGSGPNPSERPRRLVAMWFVSGDVHSAP